MDRQLKSFKEKEISGDLKNDKKMFLCRCENSICCYSSLCDELVIECIF